MEPARTRLIGNVLLALAFLLVIVAFAGLMGWVSRTHSRPALLLGIACSMFARAFRRQAAAVPTPTNPT